MSSESTKDSTHCLICNCRVGASSRNCVQIFNETSSTDAEKPLINTICSVLQKDLNQETVHSVALCKKCNKLFSEYDELEDRLSVIRSEIHTNYDKTMKKICVNVRIQEEYTDHDYIEIPNGHMGRPSNSTDKINQVSLEVEHNESIENGNEEVSSQDMEKTVVDGIEYLEEQEHEQEEEEEEVEAVVVAVAEEEEETQIEVQDVIIKMEESAEDGNTSDSRSSMKKSDEAEIKIEDAPEQVVQRDGEEYTCLLCSSDEERVVGDAKEIISHVRGVHDTRLYICDICGIDFKKRNELSMHLDDHVAKEEGDFQCEVCNRIFCNLRLFRIHKRIHYPQTKSWACESCGKKYSSKNLLEEHTNTHTGTRPYVCETCGKDFASKYTYKAHAKTHEVRPRPFECTQCTKSFLSQQNLTQHERTHNGIKDYVCHQCGKAFGSQHNLEVHNIVHTGYKPYICRICGKAFARKAEIRDHERTHTGEKPYQCEFCGATFSQRSNLQSHKRATHYNDKRYKCDDCGKGFKRRRLLDYHIKAVHTGERPYKCEICTANFVYPEHFKKHMRIHTGEKPYLCEVCGKAFNSRDNRNAHRFIHSDKKPYECLVCGMGFMRKPLLYAHMQTQGHLNDTIVVNQPRLTMEDEQTIDLHDGHVELLMEGGDSRQIEGTELYVAEFKDHFIIQRDSQVVYQEEENVLSVPSEENAEHEEMGDELVVDGQMTFEEPDPIENKPDKHNGEEQVEEVYGYAETEDGETIVVPTGDYKEIVGDDSKNSVRLVQIRIPSANPGDARSWLSLVQNT